MAIDWSKIQPKEFEKLCYRILEKEGFFNLEWYGASGQDRGRDIIGFRHENPLPGHQVQKKWLIQCKRFLTPLSKSHLYEELIKATEHQPDGVLFIVSTDLSANLLDWLKSTSKQFNFEYVFIWDAVRLESLLSKYKDIQQEFFGTQNKVVDEILETIKKGENKYIEFKETVPPPRALVREICAFANTNGGKIFLGVSDNGKVVGFKDPQIKGKVLDWCNDLCNPAILDIEVREYELPEGQITVIEVGEGDDKPYFGNNQVFLRMGTHVRNASRDEIGKYFARRGFFQYSPELDFSIDLETYRKLYSEFISSLNPTKSERIPLNKIALNFERLIETLLSSINGFEVRSRVIIAPAGFDFVITNKATNRFLARLDLYILVEWKIHRRPLAASVIYEMVARVSMLGTKTAILFSINDVSKSAERLLREFYQRDGIKILLIGLDDLESISKGGNFISILESKHARLLGLQY